MDRNIPLMRKLYEQFRTNPDSLDQSKWPSCVAGHAIKQHGEYGILRDPGTDRDGYRVISFRTGEVEDIEVVATRLLGMHEDETRGLFGVTNAMAIDWIEDMLVAHDTADLDRIAPGLGVDDDYPFGEVTA